MPQELPGFYYDAEKNRYFPIKGPIPGSSSTNSNIHKPATTPTEAAKVCKRKGVRTLKLLQGREMNCNVISLNKGKCNFIEEFLKIQASQPVVWKYQGTEKIVDGALEQLHVDIQTPEGQKEVDVLITGGSNGLLSLFEVGKVGQHFDSGVKCIPDRVWPVIEENKVECSKGPGNIWRPARASLQMSSNISCIKLGGQHSLSTVHDGFNIQHALITTLGSEISGGSIYILNLVDSLDFYSSTPIQQMIREIASFKCTIWTADCNTTRAVIGTNLGAALVNLETGRPSWVCRTKSDVLAQQLDQTGNVVLCGLRNGAIVTIDIREKRDGSSARPIRHRIPYSSLGKRGQNFELKGNIYPPFTICMPSSICCLVSLQSYDQYFLASSMDGMIRLYDHRMTKRGAVQSYEGHVNSHTRIHVGVDQSERFLMSGGEDCNLRLWSIKSGELLFEEKFSDSVLSTVCLRRAERFVRIPDEGESYAACLSGQKHSQGAWLGSQEGLLYMRWS